MKKRVKKEVKIREPAMNVDEFALDLMAILCDRIQKNVYNIASLRCTLESEYNSEDQNKISDRIRRLGIENQAYYKVIRLILKRQALDEYMFYKHWDEIRNTSQEANRE